MLKLIPTKRYRKNTTVSGASESLANATCCHRNGIGISLAASLIVLFLMFNSHSAQAQCDNNQRREAFKSIEGGTYLRDYKVAFPESRAKKPTTDEKNMVMNKGSRYRFSVAADPSKPGKPVIRIYDQHTEYITVDNGAQSAVFDFMCNKTQVYYISVHFQNGQEGCCIMMLGLMGTK
jgi:hypothetical protein